MSVENVSVVQNSYEAFARGDFPAVLAAMDPAAEWIDQESLPWAVSTAATTSSERTCRVSPPTSTSSAWSHWLELLDAGDCVVVTARFAGRAAAGEFDVGVVYIWCLRAGKVVRVEGYTDTARILQALGHDEAGSAGHG